MKVNKISLRKKFKNFFQIVYLWYIFSSYILILKYTYNLPNHFFLILIIIVLTIAKTYYQPKIFEWDSSTSIKNEKFKLILKKFK